MKPIFAKTCTEAWLKGMHHLIEEASNHREYNLITQIDEPFSINNSDERVYHVIDEHLRENGKKPLQTVINTIFPTALYIKYGNGVFDAFQSIAATIKKDNIWGTYALRMIEFRKDAWERTYCPLGHLIGKLKAQLNTNGAKKACYDINFIDPLLDLPIYDNSKDHTRIMGGPCLVHLSFKLTPDNRLNLTAIYRSHFYITRAYGNFIGLAWLQYFIAEQVGIEPAELVCHSTFAQIDGSVSEARTLLRKCEGHAIIENN